jgi:hypothetical protein
MNRWYVGLVALLICGCGNTSNSDAFGGRAAGSEGNSTTELDGGSGVSNVHHPQLIEKIGTMRASPFFHEFDVNLLSFDPIQRETDFNISSADTYKISLQTLDLLTEEKRFPLIQADKITQKGMPTIIAPIGYTVRLEVSSNQVVAVIKSTTSSQPTVQPVPVRTGNNDIIVGELSALHLLVSGIQQELSSYNVEEGWSYSATTFNRFMRYRMADQWRVQLSKRRVGVDTTMSFQVGKEWRAFDHGTLCVSAQNLYGVRDNTHVNGLSITYSTNRNDLIQGHIMASTTLSTTPFSAVGAGCSLRGLTGSRVTLGVVVSKLDWNTSLDIVLDY